MAHPIDRCALRYQGEDIAAWRANLLSEEAARRFEVHLPTCAVCLARVGLFTSTAQLFQRQHVPALSSHIWQRLQPHLNVPPHTGERRLQTSKSVWGGGALVVFLILAFVAVIALRPFHSSPPVTSLASTATMVPGVCNPVDFPTKTPGGPPYTWLNGPATGFHYPAGTYYASPDYSLYTTAYRLCSPGTPTTILTFLEQSIPANGWTLTTTTATTLHAVQTSVPQEGLCASVDITVGASTKFPGEWELDFHQPTSSCTPL